MPDTVFFEVPGVFTDTTLPDPTLADPILHGANGGIRSLFDLASVASWPSRVAPIDGDTVGDLSGSGDLSAMVAAGSSGVAFNGGGFDFASVVPASARPFGVRGPTGSLASIYSAAHDYFLVCGYYRLPSAWNTSSSMLCLFTTASVRNAYLEQPDMLTFGLLSPNRFSARRQTNGSTVAQTNSPALDNAHLGKVAQIAVWRNATEFRFRIRTTAGTVLGPSEAVGVDNAGDFSAQRPSWGLTIAFNAADQPNDLRLYRGFVDDLNLDNRDPVAILDADWATVAARFS